MTSIPYIAGKKIAPDLKFESAAPLQSFHKLSHDDQALDLEIATVIHRFSAISAHGSYS